MRKHLQKLIWALSGAAVTMGLALSYGVATGQQPGAPQPAPGASPAAGASRARMVPVQGTITQKDAQKSAVELSMPQGKGWVQLGPGATVYKQVPAKLGEIREKDFIVVFGVPTAIEARGIDLVPAGEVGTGAVAAQPAGGMDPFAPRAGAWGSAGGTVIDVKPLTLEVDKMKVKVAAGGQTRILRRAKVGLDDLAVGEAMTAWGDLDDQRVLHARAAFVGQPEGMLGPRPGSGGPSGGGRRGRR